MRTGVRVYPSSRDVAGGPRARAGGRRLVHRGAAPVQLRAQLRRTPCQMYRVTSASESSGGRLPRAEVAYLYGSEKIKIFLHDVIEPLL